MEMQYIRMGDYFIPDLELPQESRPIGRWGRMRREYLREHKPIQYNCLLLSGELWTYLADLNEQAQEQLERIIQQMKTAEGVTEALKAADPTAWVRRMKFITFFSVRFEGVADPSPEADRIGYNQPIRNNTVPEREQNRIQ